MNFKKTLPLILCCIIVSCGISHGAQEHSWMTKLALPFITAKRAICHQALKDFFWAPQAPRVSNITLNDALDLYNRMECRVRRNVIGPRTLTMLLNSGVITGSLMYGCYHNISHHPNATLFAKPFFIVLSPLITIITAFLTAITYGKFIEEHSPIVQTHSWLRTLRDYLSSEKNPTLNRKQISDAMEQQNRINGEQFDAAREEARNDSRLEAACKYAREYLNVLPSLEHPIGSKKNMAWMRTHEQKEQELGPEVFDLALEIEGSIGKPRPILPFGLRDKVIALIEQ